MKHTFLCLIFYSRLVRYLEPRLSRTQTHFPWLIFSLIYYWAILALNVLIVTSIQFLLTVLLLDQTAYCNLRNETERNEMKICILRNLYFAKSVIC